MDTFAKALLCNGKILTTEDAVKPVHQVTLEVSNDAAKDLCLEPGDAVDLIIGNPDQEVEVLLTRLKVDLDYSKVPCVKASLIPNCKKTAKIPEFLASSKAMSLWSIFKYGLEIRAVPKKPFIRLLVDFTTDKKEKRTV